MKRLIKSKKRTFLKEIKDFKKFKLNYKKAGKKSGKTIWTRIVKRKIHPKKKQKKTKESSSYKQFQKMARRQNKQILAARKREEEIIRKNEQILKKQPQRSVVEEHIKSVEGPLVSREFTDTVPSEQETRSVIYEDWFRKPLPPKVTDIIKSNDRQVLKPALTTVASFTDNYGNDLGRVTIYGTLPYEMEAVLDAIRSKITEAPTNVNQAIKNLVKGMGYEEPGSAIEDVSKKKQEHDRWACTGWKVRFELG